MSCLARFARRLIDRCGRRHSMRSAGDRQRQSRRARLVPEGRRDGVEQAIAAARGAVGGGEAVAAAAGPGAAAAAAIVAAAAAPCGSRRPPDLEDCHPRRGQERLQQPGARRAAARQGIAADRRWPRS